MGVKDLWGVASPCEERISLHQLRGQTLAVDLAGWIVQNQTAPGMSHRVTRPHLRNLVFRTTTLLNLDILPVFVLDGEAPAVKSATVAARNQVTWGTKPRSNAENLAQSPKVQKRRQFGGVLKECKRLLDSLGVPVVAAPGEAEAFCAALDRAGLVDGVVSDDSDSLCYGARVVYRNFSSDPKNYSVSKYCAKRIRKEIGISRERIVIMSLILGCDYSPGGVCGVGKENLMKLFHHWGQPTRGELDQVVNWEDGDSFEIKKQSHCGTCGHPGTVGNHRKTGCNYCSGPCEAGIPCPCDYHSPENQRLMTESNIRRKAVESPGWPHRDVVAEFYSLDHQKLNYSFMWQPPTPIHFIQICVGRMDWVEDYAREKMEGIVTRWQVRHPSLKAGIRPGSVVKTRIQGGQNMLEVEWLAEVAGLKTTFVACVPTSDFEVAYPDLLSAFLQEKEAKKKKKKPKTDKENKAPTKKNVAAIPKAKTLKGVQPSITKFMKPAEQAKDPEVDVYPDMNTPRLKEPDLRPKNLLLKKINIGSREVVRTAEMVEPPKRVVDVEDPRKKREEETETPEVAERRPDVFEKRSDVFSLEDSLEKPKRLVSRKDEDDIREKKREVAKMPQVFQRRPDVVEKSSDVYEKRPDVFSLEESFVHQDINPSKGLKKHFSPPSELEDTEILTDESYNSEISGILDDILSLPHSEKPEKQKKGASNNLDLDISKQFEFMSIKTSTPEVRGKPVDVSSLLSEHSRLTDYSLDSNISSPNLKKMPTRKDKSAKSAKENARNPRDSSADEFDEFDLEASKCTPLMERVKRRLKK